MFSRSILACLAAACAMHEAAGQAAALGDPMRPAARAPEAGAVPDGAAALRLEGIVFAASRKLALIDGEFLVEGQRFHDVKIERIQRDQVTVQRDGKTWVLRPESATTAAESGEP